MRPVLLTLLSAVCLHAQWKLSTPTPDLKGPVPKAADGKPDLSGIWEQDSMTHFRDLTSDMKPEDVPWRPEAKALRASRADGARGLEEPDANCLPQGVPKINAAPVPFKIVQTPKLVLLVYEAFNLWRQVHLDGRQLIDDPNPTWLGWSTGRWDGDTLVVETRGLNGKAWMDTSGTPGSDAMRVTERFHRTSFGNMDLEITIDDPKSFTRPWTAKEKLHIVPNTELMEFICLENEQDLKHIRK
ncbi:MAG: hypothetical protein RL328_1269 [Acidobacteriota bacterium]